MSAPVTSPPALSVEQVIQHNVRALFRRFHLNRDWIIGLVGERGSGKSLGGANIAIRDFLMHVDQEKGQNEPCWSNMDMKLEVTLSDEAAAWYGLERNATAAYQAEHIDKQSFLALDSRYEGGCLFFDEFNLEYGEARRSVANVNLMTDRAIQQLRKLQCGLIYTVLSELYVDVRIRENTDVFIKCLDVAMKPNNLAQRMEQGVVFEWLVYPMSPKVAGVGNTFDDTHRPLGPIRMVLKPLWHAIDTMERQAQGRTSYTDKKQTQGLLPVDMKEDPQNVAERDKWGWLDAKLKIFMDKHINDGEVIEITSREFAQEISVDMDDWPTVVKQIYRRLPNMDTTRGYGRGKPTKYTIPNAALLGA